MDSAAEGNRQPRHAVRTSSLCYRGGDKTAKMLLMSGLFLSLDSCLPVALGVIGADYLGLNPKKMADRAETEAIIGECEKNPSGYVKKDGVTTSTPCSGVLAAYHQSVMQYCHEHPNRSVDINGTKQNCSKVRRGAPDESNAVQRSKHGLRYDQRQNAAVPRGI